MARRWQVWPWALATVTVVSVVFIAAAAPAGANSGDNDPTVTVVYQGDYSDTDSNPGAPGDGAVLATSAFSITWSEVVSGPLRDVESGIGVEGIMVQSSAKGTLAATTPDGRECTAELSAVPDDSLVSGPGATAVGATIEIKAVAPIDGTHLRSSNRTSGAPCDAWYADGIGRGEAAAHDPSFDGLPASFEFASVESVDGSSSSREWSFSDSGPDGRGGIDTVVGSDTLSYRVSCASTLTPTGTLGADTAACGDYAALGDSYSSGEGAGEYFPGTAGARGNGCDRSAKAYPAVLASRLGFAGPAGARQRFVFVACSSATTKAIDLPFKGERAQLDRVSAADSLITLSIGGNDMQFGPVLTYCLTHPRCKGHEAPLVEKRLSLTVTSILRVLDQLRAAAPTARIVLVGYPSFMPSNGRCRPAAGSLHYLVALSSSTVEWIHKTVDQFDDIVRRETAGRANFLYVLPDQSVWGLHSICGRSSWFVKVALSGVASKRVEFFHPTAEGQRVLADEVLDEISGGRPAGGA
jgi:lysophospholipase L1-like esterase